MAKKTRKVTRKPKTPRSSAAATPPADDKPIAKLPNTWELTARTARLLWRYRRLFISITMVYGILNLLLVQGLASSTDVTSLKNSVNHAATGQLGSIVSGLSIFAVLVSSAGNGSSQTAGAYQLFLAVITSLAVIWALRKLLAGNPPRVKDAYYQGMYPLIPFVLVLMVIGLQLIPLLIGSAVYGTVITNGIAVNLLERMLWLLAFLAGAAWSFYMLSSSMIALYIVALPDMTPRKALRSARDLVKNHRWSVIRKVLCLPIILLVAAAIVMVPIIVWLTPLAQWVFFLLTMFGLVAIHSYMYLLYRELLDE